MSPGRFTVRADPAADVRVAHDVARIAQAVREAVPDAAALVLVGSFGRGEGALIKQVAAVPSATAPVEQVAAARSDGGAGEQIDAARGDRAPVEQVAAARSDGGVGEGAWRPVNDYDLVLVHPAPDAAPDLVPLCRALARELGVAHVDVEVVSLGALAALPPSMHAHDLKHGGQVIAGDPHLLDRIPPIDGSAVGLGPARLLLFNRLTCLLECCTAADLARAPDGDARFRMLYLTHKVTLSCAAAVLARLGRYHVSYRERAARFAALDQPRERIELVELATRFKLAPDGPLPDPRPIWFAVRDWYLALTFQVVEQSFERRFAGWPEFARHYRGDRRRDALRKVKWWVLDRRKYRDIVGFNRRDDIELAEIFLTAAARPDGTFDAGDTERARELLAPVTRRALTDWEACRAACVEADLRYVHPI